MGYYEIFLQPISMYATIFSLICLLVAGLYSLRQNELRLPLIFLLSAFVFDFIAVWIEAIAWKNHGDSVELWVMFELIWFLLAMFCMSMAASAFVSSTVSRDMNAYWPAWVLGGLGLILIILFTVIIPDGEITDQLRTILPLASFAYLAVGLGTKFKSKAKRGAALAMTVSVMVVIEIILKLFGIYLPWWTTSVFYILFALSFLLMQSDELLIKLNKANQDIVKFNQKLEEIIKLSPFPIVISRLSDDKILLANDNAAKTFGFDLDNIGYTLNDFFADSHNRQALFEELEEHHRVQEFEVLMKTPINNIPFWLLASANIIDYNNDVAIYAAFQDITSRKARENILENQAIRDPLTSLFNRRYFETEVSKLIKQAKEENVPYSVMMLDADLFKKVNDTYGHKIGDKILIELANKTEKALRDCDIVARYGGEEFLVFLPSINEEQACRVAERLRQSISTIVVLTENNQKVTITVSIGVSSSLISDNVETLIKTADVALYKAKENGRNRVELFNKNDLRKLQNQNSHTTPETEKNIHPVFSSENTAEISLLDGADTQKLRE